MAELLDLKQVLSGNEYPGRGIIMGKSADGKNAVFAYFIMGRSENSRNRIFVETEDGIRTQAFDPAKMTDPSLIIYHPVRRIADEDGVTTIVTNGDQTDTLRDFMLEGESYVECEAENHTDYVDLLLGVSGAGSVSIEWPAGLTPDNTNPYLTEATTPPYRIGFETVDSCRLRFLMTGALGDTDAFTVTADNVVKTVMIPR